MSRLSGSISGDCRDCPAEIELIIIPRTVDIGGFEVHRSLPSNGKHMVGPFIFWDQMGPGKFNSGHGVDVRPHPHIGLATVTYLFDGNLDHKDSLGTEVRIMPGDVNLMTAGQGIVQLRTNRARCTPASFQVVWHPILAGAAESIGREQSCIHPCSS